jgi:hypothetical protein
VPSTSKKQAKFMAAAAHNPKFAKKVGIPVSVAKEFNTADKGKKFGAGRPDLQGVNKKSTSHGKMALFKEGGSMKHSDMSKDKPMMKKVAKQEVKSHEKAMHGMKKGGMTCGPARKMAKGGVTRADGCVSKGHTKGKMIAMKKGGAC